MTCGKSIRSDIVPDCILSQRSLTYGTSWKLYLFHANHSDHQPFATLMLALKRLTPHVTCFGSCLQASELSKTAAALAGGPLAGVGLGSRGLPRTMAIPTAGGWCEWNDPRGPSTCGPGLLDSRRSKRDALWGATPARRSGTPMRTWEETEQHATCNGAISESTRRKKRKELVSTAETLLLGGGLLVAPSVAWDPKRAWIGS